MSTGAGAIIEAFGTRLGADFPTYAIVYGAPSNNGTGVPTEPTIRVHWAQARGTLNGSQLGGSVVIQPTLSVSLSRPLVGSSLDLATHQGTLDLAADLRESVFGLVMDHVMGVAPIVALAGQALWITDYTETPAVLDLNGAGGSTESVTIEISLNYSSTYGGR